MTVPTRPLMRLPFNAVDETVHLLDNPVEPWSIQLEARVGGRLDEARLRKAVDEALSRHPMARARKVPSRLVGRRFEWEITPSPDLDPVRVVDCPDDDALAVARAELQSLAVPLAESPPLRLRLARHPDGDLVMLNVNHAAIDGFGSLRLLRSVARSYAGEPDPLPDLDLMAARNVRVRLASPDPATRARRLALLTGKLADVVVAPCRVAVDGGVDQPGYGFHHLTVPEDRVEALAAIDHPGTVNDLLVAGLHLAIARWDGQHGLSCGRISVLTPVNLRPREWWEEMVGNSTLPVRVASAPRDRETKEALLEAVSYQTRSIKRGGTGAALIEVLDRSPSLPLWAKQGASSVASVVAKRALDTGLLTNLGRVEQGLSFGPEAGEAVELWFSAPTRMPLGVSVGAVTFRGRLHLAFRYRLPQFGADAARRFAHCYLAALDDYVDGAGAPDRAEGG